MIANYTANGTNYTAHIFTGDDTFTVTNTPVGITFDILVVAGGGGGGGDVGGGGGAGGLLYSNGVPLTLSSYTVKVGAPGGAASGGGQGGDGINSFFSNSVLGSLTAFGGGAPNGGSGTANTGGGGSGGGSGGAGSGGSGIIIVRYCIIVPPPTITVSDTSHEFSDVFVNATGTWSYTVSGASLTDNITVTPPLSDFTISTDDVAFVSTPLTLTTNAEGSVDSTTIYVHFVPTAAQPYSGTITNASSGAADKTVDLNGTGINPQPLLTVSPASLSLGNVITNKTSTNFTYTLSGELLTTNVTVTAPPDYFKVSSNGTDFVSSFTLSTNESGGLDATPIYVRFTPSNGAGQYPGSITNSSIGAADKMVALTGTGVVQTVYVSPTTLAFGNVLTNTTASTNYTVSGSNLEDNVTVTAPSAEFTVSTNVTGSFGSSCTVLVAGASSPSGGNLASTPVYVRFTPSASGPYSGSITNSSTGAANQLTTLSGTGVVQTLYVSAGTLAFGDVIANTTSAATNYTVSGSNLTANVSVNAPANFQVSTSSGSGFGSSLNLTQTGGTLAPTTVYVRFSPTAPGAYAADITNSSAGATNVLLAVTGNGVPLPEGIQATGGDSIYVTNVLGANYGVHIFTTVGTNYFSPNKAIADVEYLIIAGGGGGGKHATECSGGGGAGGYRCSVQGEMSGGGSNAELRISVIVSNYAVVVGGGGAGSISVDGSSGTNSSFAGVVAFGGGHGGGGNPGLAAGYAGGSGGGGGNRGANGSGTSGQGFAGGDASSAGGWNGGGGGGAGSAGLPGVNSSTERAGNGGTGVVSSITGMAVWRGGGGGGGGCAGGGGFATLGGGGDGETFGTAENGVPNTGGGGGGSDGSAGNGGSGIVIIRYEIIPPKSTVILLR